MLYLVLLYSTGNYTSTILTICSILLFFYVLYLVILSKHRSILNKKDLLIKRIGKKRFNEINNDKSIFDIIFNEILEIDMDLDHPSIHLTPSHNFTGKVKNYWDDHKKRIRSEIEFKNGTEHGTWKGWYENGQLAFEKNFECYLYDFGGGYKDYVSRQQGPAKVWSKNGELYVTLNFKDGNLVYNKK